MCNKQHFVVFGGNSVYKSVTFICPGWCFTKSFVKLRMTLRKTRVRSQVNTCIIPDHSAQELIPVERKVVRKVFLILVKHCPVYTCLSTERTCSFVRNGCISRWGWMLLHLSSHSLHLVTDEDWVKDCVYAVFPWWFCKLTKKQEVLGLYNTSSSFKL